MRSVFATAAIVLATGCPSSGDDGGDTNPSILWLAPDNSEIVVKLSAVEPPPW